MKIWYLDITLSIKEFPIFSEIYVKDDGAVLRTKLDRPFIDVSHISLFLISVKKKNLKL